MAEKAKVEFTLPLVCGHCGNKAPMEIAATYNRGRTYEDKRSGQEWEAGTTWELLLCPSCSNPSLRQVDWHEFYEPDDWRAEVLYPSTIKVPLGLPAEVEKSYLSAIKVRQIDSNAYAVLLGRVLDTVCLDRKATGKSLYERLTSLADKGEIPSRLVDMAHQLRQLRNIGAHADLGDLTPAEIPVLDDLCKAILEYVYTAPQLIGRVEKRLEELKLND